MKRDLHEPYHTFRMPASRITETEQEVIRYAMCGWTNKEIGARMGICEGTVKAHLMNAMRKTQTKNRTQLCIEFGKKHGFE